MMMTSLIKDLKYLDNKPSIQLLFETESAKEIRIAMKEGQVMKKHQAPYPIVVEIFEGSIDFGVQGKVHNLIKGDLIALAGNEPHDLVCKEKSIIRLSLSKLDKVDRVRAVST